MLYLQLVSLNLSHFPLPLFSTRQNATQIYVLRPVANNSSDVIAPTIVTSRNSTQKSTVHRSTDHVASASTSSFSKRDGLSRQESMEVLQSMILGGKPGLDFPNYARPPRTKFSCRKMDYGGMFADPETGCQVYHVCHNRRKDTFMCPTGTLFNQAIMACDFWYNVNCESATSFYNMNEQLYHPYQNRRVSFDQPSINRSDRPISPPVPSNSIPRPTYQVPVKPRQPPQYPTGPLVPRLPPPAATTAATGPSSTTTARPTTPLTPESPPTKKPTTPRVRVVTTTRSRATSPNHEVDDRDWVFAWLKQGNGTRADKEILPENRVRSETTLIKKMGLESLPLLSLAGSRRYPSHKNDLPLSADLSTSKSRISLVEIRSSGSSHLPVTPSSPLPRATTSAGAATTTTPYSMTSSTPLQQVTSTTLLPLASASRVNVTNATASTATASPSASNNKLHHSSPSSSTTSSASNLSGPVKHSPVNVTTGTINSGSNKKLQSRQPTSSWLFPLEFMDI